MFQYMTAVSSRIDPAELAAEVDELAAERWRHTTATWEGVAATAARERLDRHEERCWNALRSARGLAAELRAEAEMEDARARTDEALAGDLLRRIAGLELELGRFDHI